MNWTPVLAVLGVVACAGDKSPTGLPPLNVTGLWTANWSDLNATGLSCLASGLHLALNQIGTRFSGLYDSGTLMCNGSVLGTPNGLVVNGLLNGNAVTFELDTPNLHQGGTVSGDSMTGTATWLVAGTGGQPVTLTGTWTAAR